MKIVHDFPPNYQEIKDKFNPPSDTVFCYGNLLYVPDGRPVPAHLLIHEEVHSEQQAGDPSSWWKKYREEAEFRLSQEIEAYRKQYAFFKKTVKDKNARVMFLHRIASDLSGSLYGNIISKQKAIKQIC